MVADTCTHTNQFREKVWETTGLSSSKLVPYWYT